LSDELAQIVGDRQLASGRRTHLGLERTGNLERVEWIAGGRTLDPDEERTWQPVPELLLDDPVESAEAERTKAQPADAFVDARREQPVGVGALAEAHGREHCYGVRLQPPQRELQRVCRGQIEPLQVVDGE